ncbi:MULTISPECIES: DUF732 domain-containing protein [unclassified Mycobacterium]|uniref:DUF732 domain-containing protein n=1 Tax=unclassified Mycobacterium TaxID=2642494 RepID=UPI000800A3DF|nr:MULTISPECIES: DUF732 domain-containing protein [unclassified Mycobacterium]OBG71318.1 hypothetical protein A5700_12140 [Mycobacterium sp. E1214]OBH28686.1 hypothetical protein A5693_21455 [Mycobacterium sp. E1319]
MPKRVVTDDLAEFAEAVQAATGTAMWSADGSGGAATEIVPPVTQPEPGFAWSAENGYGDTQSWPQGADDDEPNDDEAWRRKREWRRVRGIAVLVLLCSAVMAAIILIAGHTDNSTTAMTSAVSATPPTPTRTFTHERESEFLQRLRASGLDYSDSAAIANGAATCVDLDHGMTLGQWATDIAPAVPHSDRDIFLHVAVITLCPDHTDELP